MKRIFCLMLILISTGVLAQKSIKLKVAFIPDHQYNTQTKNNTKMIMDAQVDEATKEQLKSSGMVFPVNIDMLQDMEVLMRTGQFNEKKEVPFTMEYTRFDMKQKMGEQELPAQPNPLKGMKISGWGENNGRLRFEKVEGEEIPEDVKKMLMGMFEKVETQIIFPDEPLKIGDSFTQKQPFNMPMQGGAEIKMILNTIYTLVSFDNEKATFDTIVTMTMDLSIDKGTVTAEGAGTGKMVFDIQKNYMAKYDTNIDMSMKMKMGPMDMTIKSSSQSEVTVSHL